MQENKEYYPIDLETIKTKEFSEILLHFMIKNGYYSHRYITLRDLYRKLMGSPYKTAGRGQWLAFGYMFRLAKARLKSDKRKTKYYIEPRKVQTLTSVPNMSKSVSITGYSLANSPSDFYKANEILIELRDAIDQGIKKNQLLAKEINEQQQLKITNSDLPIESNQRTD